MKVSLMWLQEYFNETLPSPTVLAEQLTLAGLEVEAVTPVAGNVQQIVIGQITAIEKHANAEKLKVCQIAIAQHKTVQVVSNAPEVAIDMKVVVAIEGAKLANDIVIKTSEVRGITSQGMLCSYVELGMADVASEILQLPDSAPIGMAIAEYLKLNDHIFDINVTPNRSDCLSVLGIAREIAALNNLVMKHPPIIQAKITVKTIRKVLVANEQDCPHYVGREIKNVNAKAITPMWLQEYLRRSDIRSINAIVDISNYVLLELGQPIHIFDADKLHGDIHIRRARQSEKLILLDHKEVMLDPDILVIADAEKAHAMAGIMGGLQSAVTLDTQNIFIESASFNPLLISGRARRYSVHSDAAIRFERGVSPDLQFKAIERVSELLQQIVGGECGEDKQFRADGFHVNNEAILLRADRISKILGYEIPAKQVESILQRLNMQLTKVPAGWQVTAPLFRLDICAEIDLIEEIARINGYDEIPTLIPHMELRCLPETETQVDLNHLRQRLLARDYSEVITYSFVEQKLQTLLDPQQNPLPLKNPISPDLAVMRTNLWPGLINVARYNVSRQQQRVRVFETGLRFIQQGQEIKQQAVIAGLSLGPVLPEQWGVTTRMVDFFDVKADLKALLVQTGHSTDYIFAKNNLHPALHPGESCQIILAGETIGYLGQLHPQLQAALDIDKPIYVFELSLADITKRVLPQFKGWSKFPMIRRDLALVVGQTVPAGEIHATIMAAGNEWLKDVVIFDVYQGKGIEPGKKSLALGLILQHPSRTLMDNEINEWLEKMVGVLKQTYDATLRE